MSRFTFQTDIETEEYCEQILREMMHLFNLSEMEALDRMNKQWRGLNFVGWIDDLGHDLPSHWAKFIFTNTEKSKSDR